MTRTASPLLFLSILSFSALLSQSADVFRPDVVTDTDGDALVAGGSYYMLAVRPSSGGGVTLANDDPKPGACPNKLAVANTKTDKGIPVSIVPQDPSATTVELEQPAEFKFAILFHCIPTTPWALEDALAKPRHLLPGRRDDSFDYFTIKYDKARRAYTLNYNDGGTSKALGVKKVDSSQFVVLGGSTFSFVFEKYSQDAQM